MKMFPNSATHFKTASVAILFAFCLGGCAGPMNDPAGKTVYNQWVNDVAKVGIPKEGTVDRDAFIFRMKAVKDYEYANYVTNLRRGTSWGEFGSDSVKIVLDSLVAVTGSASTKASLGAASAGVTGATTSVKKNVLFDQSMTTFINKMDTLRLNKWNDILAKMGRGPNGTTNLPPYSIAEAWNDLEEYGRYGSLDSALRDVAAKTSEEKKAAEATNDVLEDTSKTKKAAEKATKGQ